MIYNENDKVLHTDGTELIIISAAPNRHIYFERNADAIFYKCFSLTTQHIVTINEKDIKGFKTPKDNK